MNKLGAEISKCGIYRYSLWRIWDESKPLYTFIGLNPSTADDIEDDNTIRRCINFAKSWGGGGIYMANLFAFRSTNPSKLRLHDDPVGIDNDKFLIDLANKSEKIIACWGNQGTYLNRSNIVKKLLKEKIYCLELNKTGEPKHPLYVHSNQTLKLFK